MGLVGAGKLWEASGSFPGPAEWDLSGAEGAQSSTGCAGAAVGLQVGMLVWSSPVAAVSIAPGSSELWEVLPKLRHPRKSSCWKGKSSCSRHCCPSAPGRPGQPQTPKEFPGWIARGDQENSKCIFLCSPSPRLPIPSAPCSGLGLFL